MNGFFEPAKQVTAYSLGWSEALRAQPQDRKRKRHQPVKRATGREDSKAFARSAGSKPFI